MLEPETHEFLTALAGRPPVDEPLWLEALTHGSTGAARDYQRLEFLGDRVLGMVIGEWLYKLEQGNEGRLSQRLNALVSGSTCAAVARRIGLGGHIRLGKQARDDGGQDSDNILGDVMEALIGASFVTHGFEATRDMVRRLWADPVAGKAGKDAFVVAFYRLPGDRYRIGSSLWLKGEKGPVVLGFNGYVRRKLPWATCWDCNGESGNVTYREDGRVVITQK